MTNALYVDCQLEGHPVNNWIRTGVGSVIGGSVLLRVMCDLLLLVGKGLGACGMWRISISED